MHELSICRQMMIQINEIAGQNQASAVVSVTLKIGPLSGVEARLLKQAFPFATAQTVAENAQLIIEELPVRVRCRHCGSTSSTAANKLLCRQCGDHRTQLLSGDEMLLASVELVKTKPVKDTPSAEAKHV